MKALFIALPCLLGWWFYRPTADGIRNSELGIRNCEACSGRAVCPHTAADSPQGRAVSMKPPHHWPPSIPVFGEIGQDGMSMVRRDGDSAFLSFIDAAPPANVLDRASAAYASAGWEPAPVGTCDMVLFTRDEDVAAVLAEDFGTGTRVTAIQRRSSAK